MLTSRQIEEIREKVKRAPGWLRLVSQRERTTPDAPEVWDQMHTMQRRDDWMEILDLAAMAARIRER